MTAPAAESPTLDVLIVGSGFGGLCAGVALQREGKRSFLLLERAKELGGTWRDNVYPGCACDIPSHLYSYSFAQKPDWSRMYPTQPEIKGYLEEVARRFDLIRRIRFGRTMCAARFDAERGEWHVDSLEGESFKARALILATGGLSKPLTPKLPGAEVFGGKQMHSARWDATYDLTGKRVAVIGTGASAIQIVPELTPLAEHIYVFQRTPPWVLPKPDRAMKPWEQRLFRWLPFTQQWLRKRIFRFNEALGEFIIGERDVARAQALALRHLEQHVFDPELRAKLTPPYTIGCKRVLFSNDWYGSLQAPNVELVTDAIERVNEHSISTSDRTLRKVDCIIYATGFDVHGPSRAPIVGLDARNLGEVWREHREAYRGCTVAGFPNLFFIIGPNSGTGHNSLIYIMECQVSFILQLLRSVDRRGAKWVQPTRSAQNAYNEALKQRLAKTMWTQGHCRSWYQDPSGRVTTLWPGLLTDYREMMQKLDAAAFEWG